VERSGGTSAVATAAGTGVTSGRGVMSVAVGTTGVAGHGGTIG